jgi:PHD/YefM family antitoxin component YafN of YafNO toxin-antitoxin module
MVHTITANDIKTKGVNAIDEATNDGSEAFISIRGKNKFVVLSLEKYNFLRECELEAALLEAKNDIKKGKYFKETVDKHIKRIKNA